jgi:hypothetical protein
MLSAALPTMVAPQISHEGGNMPEQAPRPEKRPVDVPEKRCGEALVAAAIIAPFAHKAAEKLFDRPPKPEAPKPWVPEDRK